MSDALGTDRRPGFFAKHRAQILVVQFAVVFALGFAVAWALVRSSGTEPTAPDRPQTAQAAAGPSMWTCSMHPQIRQPNPGKCPICAMELIPVLQSTGGMRTLVVSPESRALMNIATAPVERKYVEHEIPMVGKVDYDQTRFGYITAWVPGRLDRLYVDYAGIQVTKGDHMVYIYSPELYSAQEELIQAIKFRRDRRPATTTLVQPIDLVEASREKLRLMGLGEEQIKEIEQQAKPSDHLTINSPVSGIVVEKLKQEGDYVKTGERIYSVADLNQVWVHLDAYESDLPWVRYGQDVTITAESYPGEQFHGRIAFVQPVLNDRTRTVKVRVNVPNPAGKLKPDMFVHGIVRPQVAAGGRVMDPSLAGKWISPMHPEVVKDEPGKCDICGMALVRAETLGFVTPTTDEKMPPLVIPYSAALVTGKRAVVYVELPTTPDGLEAAFQGVKAATATGDVEQIRSRFSALSNTLDRPYDRSGTVFARKLWSAYADRIAKVALDGQRVQNQDEAEEIVAALEKVMNELREQFAPPGQPTFEGREIVLGPRAGDYYLVLHGLEEGELVVTQGNFKLDAEVQIQAKPSMMTPDGGGGSGGGQMHDHGDGGQQANGDAHAGHQLALPVDFRDQIRQLEAAYEHVADAVKQPALPAITAAFNQFGEALNQVDVGLLTGHARMQWKELAMLLGNDAAEGGAVDRLEEADRVYLLLKGHMRRLRDQLDVAPGQQPPIERLAVEPQFQEQLAALWQAYLPVQQALAADDLNNAQQQLRGLPSILAAVDASMLSGHAQHVWQKEQNNLAKIVAKLNSAQDITSLRAEFEPLSEEIGVLAKTFGFGPAAPIYELHCPMAFEGRGGVWYQNTDQVRNPYFGATMLKCADRVEELRVDD